MYLDHNASLWAGALTIKNKKKLQDHLLIYFKINTFSQWHCCGYYHSCDEEISLKSIIKTKSDVHNMHPYLWNVMHKTNKGICWSPWTFSILICHFYVFATRLITAVVSSGRIDFVEKKTCLGCVRGVYCCSWCVT